MNAATTELLQIRDLDFRYDEKPILEGCTFSVRRRERLVIIGSSGSGKSTLLRLILGIVQPQSGSIRYLEREITAVAGDELNAVREKIGMVYQQSALISSLTIAENLALPLRELTDKAPAAIDGIVTEKLALVGMADTKDQLPSELSGGMRKRVALARALVLDPELVLFDEPSSGLDPVNAALVDELILGLSAKMNATCIVVTHQMESAFRVATHMAMLHDGAIQAQDTADRFRKSDDPIVRQFVTGATEGPLTKERDHALPKK